MRSLVYIGLIALFMLAVIGSKSSGADNPKPLRAYCVECDKGTPATAASPASFPLRPIADLRSAYAYSSHPVRGFFVRVFDRPLFKVFGRCR